MKSSDGIEVRTVGSEFKNDLPLSYMQKIDALLRFFDGDVTINELLSMDIPSQRALFQARLENLKKSQEAFANGKIDAYSRRYASTMSSEIEGTTTAHSEESEPALPDESVSYEQSIRQRSRNIKDM